MRICICGFYGYGNIGDEGILLSVINSLGHQHEYVVCTNLPFDRAETYRKKLPYCVDEIIQIDDIRADYDVLLLGGGGLTWGFGWRQVLVALSREKPVLNYGVGYSRKPLFHMKLADLYWSFLSHFDAITVRDEHSQNLLKTFDIGSTLTGCPSINLETEKTGHEDKNIACPRWEDYENNKYQIFWFIQKLKKLEDPPILIPFAPHDLWGSPVDLMLCREIAEHVPGSEIVEFDPFKPQQVKHVISKAKHVFSGGRLHALIWAAVHKVNYSVCPTGMKEEKIRAFLDMHRKHRDNLAAMERENVKVFKETVGC